MKRFALSIFKSNSELIDFNRRGSRLHSVQDRRAAVNIAVVDDEAFQPQTNLQSYGYRITPLGDIKNVKEIADYDMVLCDVLGVGRHFDSVTQGASLIAEIKNEYPAKVVVAYTGGSPSDKASRLIADRADATIRKDIDIQDWIDKLDQLSSEAIDPHLIWNKIRLRFIDLDVDTKDILLLEDAYVRSILEDKDMSRLRSLAASIGGDARAIITGLVSNAIFKAIVG